MSGMPQSPGVRRDATPFVELDRRAWARLAGATPMSLTGEEVERLGAIGEQLDREEVREVYLPLSRLLEIHARHAAELRRSTGEFLGLAPVKPTPYVIGIAGSVAAGKSTTARVLRELLTQWPEHPKVELVPTDGFLRPNAELERRGLLDRKGFPESYDQRALLRFVSEVKSGHDRITAPVYSHLRYDVVPGAQVELQRPDIVLVEGLNVLQPARPRADGRSGPAVSDFFDFSLYVDAAVDDLRRWYVERFLRMRETAFRDPTSYFARYAELDRAKASAVAERLWDQVNGPNLETNILPTRSRASLVLRKDADHRVRWVRLRKT
jgi:type I pantothenate kinase